MARSVAPISPGIILPSSGIFGGNDNIPVLSSFRELVPSTSPLNGSNSQSPYQEWLTEKRDYLNNFNKGGLEQVPISINGTDCTVTIRTGSYTHTLKTHTNISCSSYRQKIPVRKLGLSSPVAYAKGSRTIAGTMIFTVENNHPLIKMMVPYGYEITTSSQKFVIPDMIPAFDMMVHFHSEHWTGTEDELLSAMGSNPADRSSASESVQSLLEQIQNSGSIMEIYGIELLSDSVVISVDDLITEVVMNFVATAYTPIRSASLGPNEPQRFRFRDSTLTNLLALQQAEFDRINSENTSVLDKGAAGPKEPGIPSSLTLNSVPVRNGVEEEIFSFNSDIPYSDDEDDRTYPHIGVGKFESKLIGSQV